MRGLVATYSNAAAVEAIRRTLDRARQRIAAGEPAPTPEALSLAIVREAQALWQPTLRPVINASGVIIHTNLGRAPLSGAAIAAMQGVAAGYANLEYDLTSGGRGSRHSHLESLLVHLVGAEASMVVNNNAAAVLLALSAVAKGKEVIVSRGQAVEIGGHFRIPDVLRQSGCKLVEVGTTNRTRLGDYAEAITPHTAALLHVHTSNFKLIGFAESVDVVALVALGREHGVPVIDDLGSGALLDTAACGLAHEPTVQESVAAGTDLVCFSGDKLLGGPQAGLIVGRQALVDRLKRHPLARAVRVDKCTLAALQETLLHYLRGEAERQIPVWRMMAMPLAETEATARRWAAALEGWGIPATVLAGLSTVGGGSLPGETLPTWLLALGWRPGSQSGATSPAPRPPARSSQARSAAGELAARLRQGDPPVIARVEQGLLLLDPRTVAPADESTLLAALRAAHEIPLGGCDT